MSRFEPFDPCTDGCAHHTYAIEEHDVREDGFGGEQISPEFPTVEEAEQWLLEWERTHPDQLEDTNWRRRLLRKHHKCFEA